ncbi:phage baseplate assembly protein V [Marinobacter orientalis]|uniref:VgrG protein n=1 Tax=Marinobacter orientalis TaxID=1928859 RepID=A0A7Y0WTM2_9GAMM|nr:phage baseplate assembly protein V [Marinobacter orientalis]NMT64991.1 VgrG protein [Marinobacter orientalis]TGX48117.1 VgrG protein [Marinobacter orientalis]
MNNHIPGNLQSLQLAEVTDNADPENRGRIRIRFQSTRLECWASVVAPSAGEGYGASFIPREGEIVVAAFAAPDMPLVLGSIWTGRDSRPEEADPQEEHYVVRTPSGTVMEFDDSGSGPSFEVHTRSGYSIRITESDGGEINIERGSQKVTLTSSSIQVNSAGPVEINASNVNVSAGMVQVDAGMSRFSGVVQADTVIANSVVGTSYTPGAGNIW